MSDLAFWIGMGIASIIFSGLFAIAVGRFFLNRNEDIDACWSGWEIDEDPIENPVSKRPDRNRTPELDDTYLAAVARGALNMTSHDGEIRR